MRKLLTRVAIGALVLTLLVCATLVIVSPQKTPAFVDANGQTIENSIAEIRDIEINGVKQRLLIRGRDISNPVLLHLHGGPGGSDQALLQSTGKTIEDLFTVVYWDQRGAGASFSSATKPKNLTLDQIASDGIALAKKLRQEFAKEKIFLHGHSWGTLVGVHMAAKAPELFHAFISIGQVAASKRAEQLSYDFALAAADKAGDQETINKLKEIGKPPYQDDQTWIDTVMVQRGLMTPYELPDQEPLFSMVETYKIFVFYRGYSIRDKLASLNGFEMSMQKLWMEAINANLIESHPKLEIPVYFIQGKYDQHTVTEVAKDYYDALQSPTKEYLEFGGSAHWPHLREYEKYREVLLKIRNAIIN